MFLFLLITILVLPNALCNEVSSNSCPNVTVVQNFNVTAYLGDWYEQEKYPVIFEKDGKCISATYSLNDDGTVKVRNAMKHISTNEFSSIEGSARLASETGEGKLLVSFKVRGAEAPYWVLATDYTNYSVVWSCWSFRNINSKHAWILTRSQNPSDDIVNYARDVLTKQKISTEFLIKSDRTNCH